MSKIPIINLKQFRQNIGVTQEQAAQRIGIDQRQWSRYENGDNEIPIRYVIAICKEYNYSADKLLGIRLQEGRNTGEY